MSREMKDSGISYIGQIPKKWNIYRIKNGFSCKKNSIGEYWNKTQLLSLTTKGIKLKDIDNPNGKLPDSFNTYQIVNKENIVMCLFDLDMSAVFSGISNYDGMISPAYKVLNCKSIMYPRFADYYFRYIGFDRKFMHYSKNIRFTLSYEEFSSIPMLFPEVDVQKNISNYLDKKVSKIEETIINNKKSIELLEEYKISYINEKMKSESNIKMKELAVTIGDGLHGTPEYDDNGEYYFINGNNIGNEYLTIKCDTNKINENEYRKYKEKKINNQTILITLNGATYGKTSFYNNEKVFLGKSAGYITLKDTINKEFIRYYLMSSYAKNSINLSLSGSTIANVSLDTLGNLFVPYLTIEEQNEKVKEIKIEITKIDEIIKYRIKIIEKLEEYKKSLIYEAVTGKIEV